MVKVHQKIGSAACPLRVAIIGSGPAGFYTVNHLIKQKDLVVQMDMFDRLPTPFGLVRAGVAPDHQKDKSVVRAYARCASHPGFRFYGNVEYGRHFSLTDLKEHYHQVMFSTGASVDRDLGIEGEQLSGSHSATEFIAWYNGHPDFTHCQFDLSRENVAIVGVGNVAMDVARILCKSYEELRQTDIADYALEALRASKVRNVFLLGRRGPAQAAFTPPEIGELGNLPETDVVISKAEAILDVASRDSLLGKPDKNVEKNVALIREYAERQVSGKPRKLTIRFLVSPVEILGMDGRVSAIKIVRNEIHKSSDGRIIAKPTTNEEIIPVALVFRSVGYRGVALPGIPFDESWGTIDNEKGRVRSSDGIQVKGLYAAGWIKRGPTGVIGTNKTCARESVDCMIEDLAAGIHLEPTQIKPETIDSVIRIRQPDLVSYEGWEKIDRVEQNKGALADRPRIKFTDISAMLAVSGEAVGEADGGAIDKVSGGVVDKTIDE